MSLTKREQDALVERRRDRRAVVVLAESSALLVAVAMAVVPGRRGVTWSPADFIWDDPGLLVRIAMGFLFMNVLLAVVGAAAWAFTKRGED